jgi:altronate dehydratase small subunit
MTNSDNMASCFRVNSSDNVATMLADAGAETVCLRGARSDETIALLEPIALGHKVALCSIASGEVLIKYGVSIGEATCPIEAGQWVHLHNCRSRVDARSANLDVQTGLSKDTPYV